MKKLGEIPKACAKDKFKNFTDGDNKDYYQKLIESFETKIYNQYLKKPQAEFKSFLNSVQNLMVQHIQKRRNKRDGRFNSQDKIDQFIMYALYSLKERKVFN